MEIPIPVKNAWDDLCRFLFSPIAHAFTHIAGVMPQILVIAGTVLYLAGTTSKFKDWITPLNPLLLTLIASGFFGWMTRARLFRDTIKKEILDLINEELFNKCVRAHLVGYLNDPDIKHASLQMMNEVIANDQVRGAVREELAGIVYAGNHLDIRKDKLALWKNATVALGLPKPLAEMAGGALFQYIWEPERPYWWKTLRRTHTIEWIDKNAGTVTIKTKIEGLMISAMPDRPFQRRSKISGQKSEKYDEAPNTLHHKFRTGPQEPWQNGNELKESENIAEKGLYIANTDMPASDSFEINEGWRYGQDVDFDNTVIFESPTFVESLTVDVKFDDADMTVLFSSCGRVPFVGCEIHDYDTHAVKTRLSFATKSGVLTPPNGGYILTIQRKA